MSNRTAPPLSLLPRPDRLRGIACAALLVGVAASPALASVTLEGDASSLTVVADQASRREVVAALAEKFSLKTVGMTVEDSTVSGRFTGTLGQVLKSILPRNGYAIAYSNGRPVRVTFSANGAPTPYLEQTISAVPPQPPMQPNTGMAAAPPVGGYAEMQAQAALSAGPQAGAPQPQMQPPPPSPPSATGRDDMQQQIAESTARALVQLKQLTNDLKKVGP
jgi:hypothetical protein